MKKNDTKAVLEIETKLLPVRLTDTELLARADELSRTLHDVQLEESAQENTKAAMKERLGTLNKEVDRLAEIVRTKSETRDVEVKTRLVTQDNIVETYRIDTSEVIGKRVMTAEERNLKLFPHPAEALPKE